MSRERKVMVASTFAMAATPATTKGQLTVMLRTPAGALEALAAAKTIATHPSIIFALGKGVGLAPDMVEIKGKFLTRAFSANYVMGSAKNAVAGYNGVDLNLLPVNLYSDYEYAIRIMPVDTENENAKWEPTGKYFTKLSAYNTPSAAHGRYNLIKDLVANINAATGIPVNAYIRQSETMEQLLADCDVVTGSTTVTCADTSTLVAGDFVTLGYSTYKVVSVVPDTTFEIDRPWEGAAETIQYTQALGGTAAVTNGSTAVASTTHGAIAGDYVSLGNVVYKVVSATTNAFVIDRPYEGATNASLTALAVPAVGAACLGSACFVLSATVDDETGIGIHFEASEIDEDFTVSFEGGFDGGEQATVAYSALTYSVGSGTEAVAEDLLSGPSFGLLSKVGVKPDVRSTSALETSDYNKWGFVYDDPEPSNMSMTHNNLKDLEIYMLDGATVTNFYTYLNNWVASTQAANQLANVS